MWECRAGVTSGVVIQKEFPVSAFPAGFRSGASWASRQNRCFEIWDPLVLPGDRTNRHLPRQQLAPAWLRSQHYRASSSYPFSLLSEPTDHVWCLVYAGKPRISFSLSAVSNPLMLLRPAAGHVSAAYVREAEENR